MGYISLISLSSHYFIHIVIAPRGAELTDFHRVRRHIAAAASHGRRALLPRASQHFVSRHFLDTPLSQAPTRAHDAAAGHTNNAARLAAAYFAAADDGARCVFGRRLSVDLRHGRYASLALLGFCHFERACMLSSARQLSRPLARHTHDICISQADAAAHERRCFSRADDFCYTSEAASCQFI